MSVEIIEETYLPFTTETVSKYFVEKKNGGIPKKHITKFKKSAKNYTEEKDISIKIKRQIEKDETFWTASSLISVFESKDMKSQLINLFSKAFGDTPPLKHFNSWKECLMGDKENIKMYFEANYSSPSKYLDWLKNNTKEQNIIPYLREKAQTNISNNKPLEGATNVDCIIINTTNNFSVIIEAKVLSDISYSVTYDCQRNQIIRNLDIMLESYNNLHENLNKKDPEKCLFILLTPRKFTSKPYSRLYSYKLEEYKNDPETIQKELSHRNISLNQARDISNRIGWLCWEDIKEVNPDCCIWM